MKVIIGDHYILYKSLCYKLKYRVPCDWLLSEEKACDWLRIEPGVTGNFLLGNPVINEKDMLLLRMNPNYNSSN